MMVNQADYWPKKPFVWHEGRTRMVSIPFTWELPRVLSYLKQRSFFWDNAIVGGPAVELIPGYFDSLDYVEEGHDAPGVLQRINPYATRTTVGCIRRCKFCGIGTKKIEPIYRELDDWPDLPVLCDNNLLAASKKHFDSVISRLIKHGWTDFAQGIDSRLLTYYHATEIARISSPKVRLALDHMDYKDQWKEAFDLLRAAGIAKKNITSYCLVGFQSDPVESWTRCDWVESHGIKAMPMWFHELDQLEKNIVTDKQAKMGWTEKDRLHIMGFYYKHRGNKPNFLKG